MTSYQEEAVLVMHFDLRMGVEDIADDFAKPCELFGEGYLPIYIRPREISHVIGKEMNRWSAIVPSSK